MLLYCLLYYRMLGGVLTALSLVLSGVMVYAIMVLLGRYINFTLDLAGIAGLIIGIGMTADSFVVFFERIKDEMREGRSFRSAVPRGWARARRTILSGNAVSFIAAAVLYVLAIGQVRGFAFTLGLTTVLDVVVVFLVTWPLVHLPRSRRSGRSPVSTGWVPCSRSPRNARLPQRRRRSHEYERIDQVPVCVADGPPRVFAVRFGRQPVVDAPPAQPAVAALHRNRRLEVVGRRRFYYILTGTIVLISLLSILVRGFTLGIDFEGGSRIQFPPAGGGVETAQVEEVYSEALGMDPVSVQTVGSGSSATVQIRSEALDAAQVVTLQDALYDKFQPKDSDGNVSKNVISIADVSETWGGRSPRRR